MIEHASPISGVDSLAGRLVATAGYDNRVILWRAREKRAIARAFHDHLANQCRFSPCGRYLVTASSDHTGRVWSVPALRLHSVLGPHDDDVEMATFDGASERIATACRDGVIRIFALGGQLLRTLRGHDADVLSVEWVSDTMLMSSSDDGTVRRWDVSDGQLLETIDFEGVETDTFSVFQDSGQVCVGNDRGEITVVLKAFRSVTRAHEAGIKRVIAGPNGLLLTTSYDRTAKVWRSRLGTGLDLLEVIELPAEVWPRTAIFVDAGHLIFGTFGTTYASYDIDTRRWDLSGVAGTGGINAICIEDGAYTIGDGGIARYCGELHGEVGSLCNFIIRVSGRTFTGGQSGRLFDAGTGEVLHQHRSPLNCATVFEANGDTRLIVGTYTGEAILFRIMAKEVAYLNTVTLHDNAVKAVANNGLHLFSVCATGAAAFHKLPGLEPVLDIPRAHSKIANGAAVLPDGRFVSVGRDRMLRIWSPERSIAVTTPHDHSIKCVATVTGTNLIATGGYDGTIGVYDWMDEVWVKTERPTTSGISSLGWDPAQDTVVAASYDGSLYEVSVR